MLTLKMAMRFGCIERFNNWKQEGFLNDKFLALLGTLFIVGLDWLCGRCGMHQVVLRKGY